MHIREQSETSIPSLVPIIDGLLTDLENEELKEGNPHFDAFRKASEVWIELVRSADADDLEQRIQQFRKDMLGSESDQQNRSDRDATLLPYLALYAIEFATAFRSIGQINTRPLEVDEIQDIIHIIERQRISAVAFLTSIGIMSPHEAIIQQQWLKNQALSKAKEAGVERGILDQDGRLCDDN